MTEKVINRFIKQLIIFTATLFVLTSCSDEQRDPLSRGATVVAFGDSLTYGIGARKQTTYPEALSELTGMEVINEGISGETTSQGVKRFSSVLNRHSPELVILMEGGNDILRNQSQSRLKRNLATMIEEAQSLGIEVVLIGVPEKKLFSDSASLYTELADEYQLIFDGEVLSDLLRSAEYKSDSIHLNSAGYQKLAQRIHELMLDSGLLLSGE